MVHRVFQLHMTRLLLFLTAWLMSSFAAAQSPGANGVPASACELHILADDEFEVFVNGKSTWKASDYENVLKKPLPLQRGDILVISVTDKQGGLGGMLATVLLRNNAVLASTKDFRYTVNPTADFMTIRSLQGLRSPDFEPLHKSFGLGPEMQPKRAWSQKSDQKYGTVHFKYIVP